MLAYNANAPPPIHTNAMLPGEHRSFYSQPWVFGIFHFHEDGQSETAYLFCLVNILISLLQFLALSSDSPISLPLSNLDSKLDPHLPQPNLHKHPGNIEVYVIASNDKVL